MQKRTALAALYAKSGSFKIYQSRRNALQPLLLDNMNDTQLELKVTRLSLKKVHDQQISLQGSSSKEQQQSIIDALGGADQVLASLLVSNAIIEQNKLDAIHHIISNTQNICRSSTHKITANKSKTEVKEHSKTITYTFCDDDMILFQIFNQKTATDIISMVNSNITKIILAMIWFLYIMIGVSYGDIEQVVLSDILQAYWSFSNTLFGTYAFLWMLCANKEALKLITKEFVFWFKILYLAAYLITDAVIEHLEQSPIHMICTSTYCDACLLTLTMLTDTLNIKQSSKIILTAFALALFTWNNFYYEQASLYQLEIYEQSNISIPDYFGFDAMQLNMVTFMANFAQILAIFSLKQFVAAIIKPHKASILKIDPVLNFKPNTECPSAKSVIRRWKAVAIVCWIFTLIINAIDYTSYIEDQPTVNTILFLIVCSLEVGIIILLSVGGIKSLYTAIGIIILDGLINTIGIMLFGWDSSGIAEVLIGFGVVASYTLQHNQHVSGQTKQSNDLGAQTAHNYKRAPADDSGEQTKEQMVKIIYEKDIQTANQSDNIDRQKSIDSILNQREELSVDSNPSHLSQN